MGGQTTFVPPQWGNLQLWVSADVGTFSDTALTTAVTTDGTAIGGWQDRGPLAHNATQATGARQPLFKQAGINNHPSVLFASASSQWLACDAVSTAFSGSNLPKTVIAVVKLVSTASQAIFCIANSGNANPIWWDGLNSAGPIWEDSKHDDTTHSTLITGGTPDTTNPHIATYVGSGTNMQIIVDGANIVGPSGQTISPTTMNNASIGTISSNGSQSTFTNAHVSELFVWSVALSAGEQQAVRAAMAKKYGIAST